VTGTQGHKRDGEVNAAFDAYVITLREAGYVVEDWIAYDGSRLGLFVTGRNRSS
jgi:hypothetical protein